MTKNWILDVMADLRTFARDNQMPHLAAQLEDAAVVAMSEMASLERRKPSLKRWDDGIKAQLVDGAARGRN